ncbi:helix-turn-helix domain-containing protein [Mesorhizobium sp.]|uniref:helix-turn-helix domain-containing protein n=1 Tax=Mesorhizobium sp. TaxID=1871066 RepID=UPI0025FB8F89|nr:helix-turn-helix domain-containing protein [Mesorhizobium sp.]
MCLSRRSRPTRARRTHSDAAHWQASGAQAQRAQILLAADAGQRDETIATTVVVGGSTVYRTKRRFVEIGLEAALSVEPRTGAER